MNEWGVTAVCIVVAQMTIVGLYLGAFALFLRWQEKREAKERLARIDAVIADLDRRRAEVRARCDAALESARAKAEAQRIEEDK